MVLNLNVLTVEDAFIGATTYLSGFESKEPLFVIGKSGTGKTFPLEKIENAQVLN